MALNLNKGDDNNSNPSPEKKGLNLSKSGDSEKVKQNLTKDNPVSGDDSKSASIQTDAKKKSPALFITVALVLIGLGVFWFMSTNNTNQNKIETAVTNEVPETTPSEATATQTKQSIDSNNTNVGDNIQAGEVNSNPPLSTVSTSANENTTNPNSAERVSATTNQNSIANVVPSSTSVLPSGSIEEKAREVISGAFGNGIDRKNALGDEYAIIQAKVNEIYRNKLQ
jgi:hypothetical protein